MKTDFNCPICGSDDWEVTRRYRFARSDSTRCDGAPLDAYLKLRRRVLFEVWFPQSEDVILDSLLCNHCGFMCFSPRPTPKDIDNKYRFLQVEEKDIGGQRSDRASLSRDRARSKKVFDIIAPYFPRDGSRILDVGGGNGKILLPFIEAGHVCSLVDYNVNPIAGVKKIADRLEDVPADAEYDAIICSHVMEHLAEPAAALNHMSRLLADGGIIYGEVPLGVWGGIGIENDPVTHVNFFTEDSYKSLFFACGLDILEARQTVGIYNRRIDVIYVVAEKGAGQKAVPRGGAQTARRLSNPTFLMKLSRVFRLRHR
jgi:SAM-dependent methyltransferase